MPSLLSPRIILIMNPKFRNFLVILIIIFVGLNVSLIYLGFFRPQLSTQIETIKPLSANFETQISPTTVNIQKQKGKMFMVGIPDKVLSNETIKFLTDNNIGGVVLLGNNIEDETQLKKLTSDLKEKVAKDILIAIDQEGGTVVRIKWDKYKDLSARDIGNKKDTNLAYEIALYRGKLLKELGINVILGPVADISNKNSFMYDRSFGSDAKTVTEMVAASVRGYKDAGIHSVLKHFPGHGKTTTDSHQEFPMINLGLEQLKKDDFLPFKAGIDAGAEIVMLGHIINTDIDSKPASLSKKYIELLEQELGFEGVVITDDLSMTGKINSSIPWGINLTLQSRDHVKALIENFVPEGKYYSLVENLE